MDTTVTLSWAQRGKTGGGLKGDEVVEKESGMRGGHKVELGSLPTVLAMW